MTITVAGPGSITIDFPDGTDHGTIDSVMRQATGQAQPSAPVTAGGLAAQGGLGLAEGALGIAGAAGDVRELTATGAAKLAGTLGASPEHQEMVRKVANAAGYLSPIPSFKSSGELQKDVESLTGAFPEAKNFPEQALRTVGKFIPAAIGGEGGIIPRVIKQAVIPGLASELAGQAAVGTAAEPYVRAGTALAAGGLGSLADTAFASRQAAGQASKAIGTTAELKQAAKDLYQSPEVKNLELSPSGARNRSAMIENDLLQQGFRPGPDSAAGAFGLVRELRPGTGVKSVSVDDIDAVRRGLGRQAKARDLQGQATENANAAQQAMRHIDDYLTTLDQRPGDVIRGDVSAAIPKLLDARANYAGYKRASEVDSRLNQADRQAAKSGSGSNIENAMRQKIDKVKDYGLTPDQIAQKEAIVLGTGPRNVLRKVGKLGVDGGLSLLLHAGTAYGTGGLSIPVAIGGTIARKIGEGMTRSQIEQLNQSIRAAAPFSRQRLAAMPQLPQAQRLNLLKALLLSNAATLPTRMPSAQAQP